VEDWLDIGEAKTVDGEDWLALEDPNAGKTTAAFQHLVNSCMRGTDRVMACDGQYLAYRPYNRECDKETNPRTKERFNMFIEKGLYKHLGTYDEVQIYELLPGNPYRHEKKSYVVGVRYWEDIRKVAKAALERQWADYHDLLGAMATALKAGRDPGFARTMWQDTLHQVAVAIKQMGGPAAPSEREINEGFVGIRRARGIDGKGGMVMTLDSGGLQKVGFEK
jgi:hypothetical protein